MIVEKTAFKKISFLFYIVLSFWHFISLGSFSLAQANEIQAAVATNFYNPFKEIVRQFERRTGHKVLIISGSTGKLYAQIVNGAPFDLFLAADSRRPQLLEKEDKIIPGTRFNYALGKITLWSPDADTISDNVKSTLLRKNFAHLAMANPVTAPYGKATLQTLKKLGLWDKLRPLVVQGENIGQTFHFVFSKNAGLGFVALSQVLDPKNIQKGKRVDVPDEYYDPLKQDVVLLKKEKLDHGAKDLWQFLRGDLAKRIIKKYGYGLP